MCVAMYCGRIILLVCEYCDLHLRDPTGLTKSRPHYCTTAQSGRPRSPTARTSTIADTNYHEALKSTSYVYCIDYTDCAVAGYTKTYGATGL